MLRTDDTMMKTARLATKGKFLLCRNSSVPANSDYARVAAEVMTAAAPTERTELPAAVRFATQLAVYFAEVGRARADGDSLRRKPMGACPITSYFDVRDVVLASVSRASLSYASAAPVMVALAIRSTVLSAVERISLERERQ
jgi:hypothetical protein